MMISSGLGVEECSGGGQEFEDFKDETYRSWAKEDEAEQNKLRRKERTRKMAKKAAHIGLWAAAIFALIVAMNIVYRNQYDEAVAENEAKEYAKAGSEDLISAEDVDAIVDASTEEIEEQLALQKEETLRYRRIVFAQNAEMYKMAHPNMTDEEAEVYQSWTDEYDRATEEYFDYLKEHPETEPEPVPTRNPK